MQPPGSIDFHHSIRVRQLHATIDVHIHYSFEEDDGTLVSRWLVLDVTMPIVLRPLRFAITSSFDNENRRTMAAVKEYAERHPRAGGLPGPTSEIAASSSPEVD